MSGARSFEYYMSRFHEGLSYTKNVDYGNRDSVRRNNRGVDMYRKAASSIGKYHRDRVTEFAEMLASSDRSERRVCACCLIEFLEPDPETREQALQIIRYEAEYGDWAKRFGWIGWLRKHAPQELKDKLTIYKLQADNTITDSAGIHYENVLIGFFESQEICERVKEEYRLLPGFSFPGCRIHESAYYVSNPENGKVERVYLVYRILERDSGLFDRREVGVFSSMKEAEDAKAKCLEHGYDFWILDDDKPSDAGILIIEELEMNGRYGQDGFEAKQKKQY